MLDHKNENNLLIVSNQLKRSEQTTQLKNSMQLH
jgi:hypothetical protein